MLTHGELESLDERLAATEARLTTLESDLEQWRAVVDSFVNVLTPALTQIGQAVLDALARVLEAQKR